MATNQRRFQMESDQPAAGDSTAIDMLGTGIFFDGKVYPILVDGVPLLPAGGCAMGPKSQLSQKATIAKGPQQQLQMQQQQRQKKNVSPQTALTPQFKAPGMSPMLHYQQQQLQPQFEPAQQLQQLQQFQPNYLFSQQQQYQPHHQFQLQQQFQPPQQFRPQLQSKPQQQSRQHQQQSRHQSRQHQQQSKQPRRYQQQQQQQQQQRQQQQPQQQQQPEQSSQQAQQMQQQQMQQQQMHPIYGHNMNQNPSQGFNFSWPGYSMAAPSDLMRTFAIDLRHL